MVERLTVETVVFFAVPVVIAAAPLLARRRSAAIAARGAAAGLLLLWVLFLAFAGGHFYLPAVGLMVAAAVIATGNPLQRMHQQVTDGSPA